MARQPIRNAAFTWHGSKSAHSAHLIGMNGMDDHRLPGRASLEECMSKQVEIAEAANNAFFPTITRYAQREQHIADLRHGRVW